MKFTDKKLNPKLEAIKAKYKNGIPESLINATADKLADVYIKGI